MPAVLERIGWVLIHFLWEGTLIGAVAWLGCFILRTFSASTRYNFLCCCLFVCGIAPVLTWFWIDNLDWEQQSKIVPFTLQSIQPATMHGAGSPSSETTYFSFKAIPGPALNYVRLNWLLHRWLRLVTVIWAALVTFFSFRICFDYCVLSRLISSGKATTEGRFAPRRDVMSLTVLARRMGIQKIVLLMESPLIDVPSVVGWIKPILLVPMGFLGSMPPEQIEAILAHELAHVRRCDYIVNLFQIVIETFLFYHPTVRWINSSIREERENCCDDIAVSVAGDKMVYVSALSALAERCLPRATVALAADDGSLFKRVYRVLGAGQPDETMEMILVRKTYTGMLLGVLALGLFLAASFTSDHGSIVKHVDEIHLTKALVSASKSGDLSLMESLIQQGADINRNVPPTGENALFAATTHSQVAAMEVLLRNGASVDARNNSGISPLNWASAVGNFSMVKLLHDRGAQISQGAWAATIDDLDQLKSLLAKGTLTTDQTNELMKYAISMGHLDVVQFLEKATGKPVTGKFLADAASSGNLAMMAYILKQGADIHTDGSYAMGQVVLFFDQPEAAKYLLQHGANPNQFTIWGRYLLSEAQSAKMVKVLLEAGANPNSQDRLGTPLSAAPDAESVRLLVRYGANLHPRLPDGISLIESAVIHDRNDKPDVVKELIKQGADFEPQGNGIGALALAAARNKVETMKCLLDLGVNPNHFVDAPFLQSSVMRSAVLKSSIDAVKLLLEQGVTASGDSQDGVTPSSLALYSGDGDMANLLHEGGARDVDELFLAAAFGDVKEVSGLISRGANVNEKDRSGHTPLFYALHYGQVGIVRLLLDHGAIVNRVELSSDSK